jgi:acetyl-CoA carboxylase biotin carboxylase subunit
LVTAGFLSALPNAAPIWRHAIECRIYAEDPDNNFFPSPGKITLLLAPSGPGIRRDSGMYEGWTVPIDYDPLLAKLIGYGTDRAQATSRLVRALNEYFVGGIKTNISLFRRILSDSEFVAGRLDTGYLDRLLAQPIHNEPTDARAAAVAAIAAGVFAVLDPASMMAIDETSANGASTSNWKRAARQEGIS